MVNPPMHWNDTVRRFFALRLAGAYSRLVTLGLAGALVFLTAGVGGQVAYAKGPALPEAVSGTAIALADLPKQGRETHAQILKGGPFAYDKDGTVFGNRERILPAQKRGYYREYTVKTPYARTRGAKRIVCGGSQPTAPEACYYSDDHYASFKRIVN
jgi:ribonuclease T1